MVQISLNYGFRVVRLIIYMLMLSYFVGTIWYIFSKVTSYDDTVSTFYNEYELEKNEDSENLIIVVYFAFTTLSTVGFGDFHPKSEWERIITTFILLIGVACFSYIMGDFIGILMSLQTVTADNEDSENLSKWLGLLAHFNKNRPLKKEMTKKFENYFEYYWQHDKNYAIQREIDKRFMDELPKTIQCDIYKSFLFSDFLYTFTSYFKLLKLDQNTLEKKQTVAYTWEDNIYQGFVIKLLKNLEPRFFVAKETIYTEEEEVNEQIFVMSGAYCIGFTIEQKKFQHVKLQAKTVICGYENVLGKKSEFFIKALNLVEGFGLRKMKMKPILDKCPDFKEQIQRYMVHFHYNIIRKPLLEYKKEILMEISRRQDVKEKK